jgi:hypothetical protein
MAMLCRPHAAKPRQKNCSTHAWLRHLYRARATLRGANLFQAHASGASDKLSYMYAVPATIRDARIFTIPHFRCPTRQTP